jgi:hypothetical protein
MRDAFESSRTATILFLAFTFLHLLHVALASHSNQGSGFHSFVSRPDIKAPVWDVILYPHEGTQIAPGYWFVAPYRGHDSKDFAPDRGWVGPHIYAQDGSLIWSDAQLVEAEHGIGAVEAFTLSQVDFGKGNGVEGMLTAMDLRFSSAVFIDNHYKIRRKEDASGPGAFNTHELNFVEDGTKALVVYTHFHHNSTLAESQLVGYEGECHSICNGIVEFDVKTWDRTWIWSSCPEEHGKGYIALDESTMKDEEVVQKRCEKRWDYIHANSADKTPEGDYVFSCRHADALYKISHKDGSIIWRLGGTKSDFVHIDDFRFTRQHMVRYRGGNSTHTILSILDNAKGQEKFRGPSHPFSRGLIIALDESSTPMTAEIIGQYDHPDGPGNHAHRRGGCQILPNGNVFMGWSEQALMSEHAADGTILMQARLQPEWMGSYRAFKFEDWVGMPDDPPDVVARAVKPTNLEDGVRTEVFVSWNGATEVVSLPSPNLIRFLRRRRYPNQCFTRPTGNYTNPLQPARSENYSPPPKNSPSKHSSPTPTPIRNTHATSSSKRSHTTKASCQRRKSSKFRSLMKQTSMTKMKEV